MESWAHPSSGTEGQPGGRYLVGGGGTRSAGATEGSILLCHQDPCGMIGFLEAFKPYFYTERIFLLFQRNKGITQPTCPSNWQLEREGSTRSCRQESWFPHARLLQPRRRAASRRRLGATTHPKASGAQQLTITVAFSSLGEK